MTKKRRRYATGFRLQEYKSSPPCLGSPGVGVWLAVNKDGYSNISFDITSKKWTLYESQDPIFCPVNTSLTIGVISGGISSSAILIDMIEITKQGL